MKRKILGIIFTVLCQVPAWSASDLTSLNVFPNPVRPYLGHDMVTFANVTDQLRLRIYTAKGTLVREINLDQSGGSVKWDMRNDAGQDVASGVYIYLVTNSAGEHKTGKIGVIR